MPGGRGLLLMAAMLLVAQPGFCGVYQLSIDACVSRALNAEQELVSLREQADQADADVAVVRAERFPTVTMTGSYNAQVNRSSAGITSRDPQNPGFFFQTFERSVETAEQINSLGLGVRLAQPLYTWGRLRTKRSVSLQNARFARKTLKEAEHRICAETRRACYAALLAQQLCETTDNAVGALGEHLRRVQTRNTSGAASKFDVLFTKTQLQAVQLTRARDLDNLRAAQSAVKKAIGIDADSALELRGDLDIDYAAYADAEKMIAAALRSPAISAAAVRVNIDSQLASLAALENKPVLSLMGDFGYQKFNGSAPLYSGEEPASALASLVLTMPVSEWFPWSATAGTVNKMKSRVIQSNALMEKARDEVRREIRDIHALLQGASARLEDQQENIQTLTETVALARERYQGGVSSNAELIGAEVAVFQARREYLQMQYDYALDAVRLDQLTASYKREPE